MGKTKAVYKNSFCMDYKCIYHFENTCMLCLQNTEDDISPYNVAYIEMIGRGNHEDCKQFPFGTHICYELDGEELGRSIT